MLIWPQEAQLVDLIGFAEMSRHDFVPFFDSTSKHSDVGHHSSVMVEIGVEHQGFKRVIGASRGPGRKKKKSSCASFYKRQLKMIHMWNVIIWARLRWDPVHDGLEHLFNICSKFGWNLRNTKRYFLRKVITSVKKYFVRVLHLTRMHSSLGISNTFSIWDSTLSGSAFFKSIWGKNVRIVFQVKREMTLKWAQQRRFWWCIVRNSNLFLSAFCKLY